MRENTELKIKYRSKLVEAGEINGKPYLEYEHDYVSAETSHVKRYNSALMVLMGVSGCELHLLQYLTSNMTDGGLVHNNEITRAAFIGFHSRHKRSTNKPYSDNTVQKAFMNLQECGILIKQVRGVYLINPQYYFKGDESDRIKSIRLVMEFKSGIETKINVEVSK